MINNGLHWFNFKTALSLDKGLIVTNKNAYNGASRDVTFKSVPGRSGDLCIDNKRYNNINIKYDVAVLRNEYDISELAHNIKGWLLSEAGYFRLYDSYDVNYFRLASYSDEIDIDEELPQFGSSSIKFNCKPFKYSIEGQRSKILTAATNIVNAEYFESSPYIKINGSGTITLYINNASFAFENVDEYIEVDGETKNAYKGTVAQNNHMLSNTFPTLTPGANNISWTGTVESIEIIPRWCCL
ncbi:MAG: hypothetical protein A2Y17_12320 [Clostridiales bacterium GWF2_38_85]|nr:MAG: hypothetical protein A2Y17_12320 [Clostridiales bacterium GWF2_38_85]